MDHSSGKGRWEVTSEGRVRPGTSSEAVLSALLREQLLSEREANKLLMGYAKLRETGYTRSQAESRANALAATGLVTAFAQESGATPWARLLVVGIAALGLVYYLATGNFWQPTNRQADAPVYLPVGDAPEARAQAAAVWQHVARPPADINGFRRSLRERDYQAAEEFIGRFQRALESDVTTDMHYVDFLRDITAGKGFLLSDLDAWVEETDSAKAFMVRAFYYHQAAWSARGGGWARDTSSEQLDAFRRLLALASEDALAAAERNPRLLPQYSVLVSATRSRSVDASPIDYLNQAIEHFPGALSVRLYHINMLDPRWGGSYDRMDVFAQQSLQYAEHNPRLWLLPGYSHAERGRRAMRADQYADCVYHYSRALQHGIHDVWLQNRAHCLDRLAMLEEALRDVETSLAIHETPYRWELKQRIERNL